MSKPCYLYLIEAEWSGVGPFTIDGLWQEIVKVGISENPNGRLAAFATACPFPIRLVMTRRLPSRQAAQAVERWVHDTMVRFRTHGEWFLMSAVGAMGDLDYGILDYFVERCQLSIDACVPHLLQAGIPSDQIADLIGSQYGETPACLHDTAAGLQ